MGTSLKYRRDNTLASDKVLYVGHAIAAVAASDPHTAASRHCQRHLSCYRRAFL